MSPLTIIHCTHSGTCAQRWTMNEHSFFLYRNWKQNPKYWSPTTTSAFQVSALFNRALKWSLNRSCSGQKWPQLANNPIPFKPQSQPTRQHWAASASGLDSRRTFRLIHIFPRLPFSFSSSLHCVLKSHCLHYLKLCSMLRGSAEKRECTGLERWIENCT